MRTHFGELGQLRRREAIADDDPSAVEAIAFQFPGTEAAAGAHAWLGDRELSMGHVAQAASHYRDALPDLAPGYRDEALARLRLAEALRGHDVGKPVTVPVNLGEVRMEAAEFEQLVGTLREARARLHDKANIEQENIASPARCPAWGRYEVKPWARITCRDDVMPEGLERCDRRFAAVISGDQMIVTDQVRQTAIDLKNGHVRWQQKKPAPVVPPDKKQAADAAKEKEKDKEKGKEKEKKPPPLPADFRWSLAPMTPAVDHGRVYVGRLSDQQSEFVCLDAANGKPLWSAEAIGSAIANVLLIGQELLTITARQPFGGQLDVILTGFDPASGQMQSQAPLADFRDYCNRALHCRAVAVENKIIACVGGTVICCDLPGRVRWLRRQIFVPPPYVSSPNELKTALLWHQQTFSPPLAVDGRVYVTQPGVWGVECLDVDNGRLIWRQPLPEITGLAGRIDQRLVVGATGGLLALDTQTGKVAWRCEISDRLDPILCGSPGGILAMRRETTSDAKGAGRPVLVWIDPETGKVVDECVLKPPTEGAMVCSPIIAHADRQWLIFTVPDKPDVRDIVELVTATETTE
jgi:outer membrane protein assembly factor BamB